MSSLLKTNSISAATGSTVSIPSGTTLDIASGATITNSGTATGFADVLTDFCRLSAQSTFTTLVNNVMVTLAFDTQDYDEHGSMANLANNRIDIQNAGYYIVGGQLNIGTDSANESRYLWINHYDNSASTTINSVARDMIMQTSQNSPQYLDATALVYLDVNDYVTMQGFSNGGGGPTTTAYNLYCGRVK